MDKVYFKVDGQSLIKTGGLSTYASHTVKYIEAEFALTDEWLSYDSIRAIWQNGDTDIPTAVTHGKTVVPAGVLTKKGRLIVNLVASTVDGDEIDRRLTTYPTTAFMITVEVKIDGADPEIITPSQFEQFVHAVKEDADRAEDGADRSEAEADRAESEADQATASAQASESSALRASGYADDANGYAQDAAGSATASARSATASEGSATASANSASESANSASASATSAREAEAAKETILRMRAVATSLPEGSQATASYSDGVLTLGIPKGDKGDTGNGIDHVVLNEDYTLTIFFTDGTSTITTSIRGEKGETGAVPDFTIGEVVTLDPDEEASAEITGTAENPILNLGIPQGKTGEVSYEDLSSLLPTDTANGDIISIPDGQPIIPAQSLKVQLEAIQDLHGYDKPWSGGSGVNKWDEVWELGDLNTNTGENYPATDRIRSKNYVPILPSTTYYNSCSKNIGVCFYDTNKEFIAPNIVANANTTFTTPANAYYLRFYVSPTYGTTYHNDIAINYPSSVTTYSPYSNICPISGHTEVNTQRVGKNLFDGIWESGAINNSNGENIASNASIRTKNFVPLKGGKRYVVSWQAQSLYMLFMAYKADGTFSRYISAITANPSQFSLNEDEAYIRFYTYNNTVEPTNMQIELGTIATSYEPYNGGFYHTEIEGSYTPVASDDTPYIMRATPDVDGDRLRESIIGASVGWNQLVQNGDFADSSAWANRSPATHSMSFANNKLSSTVTAVSNYIEFGQSFSAQGGHKYLVSIGKITTPHTIDFVYFSLSDSASVNSARFRNVSTGAISSIVPATTTNNIMFIRCYVNVNGFEIGDVITFENVSIIDLTQLLGTTIADYVYSLEQSTSGSGVAWLKRYFDLDSYHPFDSGSIQSVSGLQSHDMAGFNQWDEEWEVGGYDNTTGAKRVDANSIRSKNLIPVLPNTTYYYKAPTAYSPYRRSCFYDANGDFIRYFAGNTNDAFTTPDGCYFMTFWTGEALSVKTYNHDICINISGDRNGTYEPYVKQSYPLDNTLTLRGVPKLNDGKMYYDGDVYESDGTVTRKYGVVDLGTLRWVKNASYAGLFNGYDLNPSATLITTARHICSMYTAVDSTTVISQDCSIAISADGKTVYAHDDSYTDATAFKSAMSGVMLVYELATPTTEDAIPFAEIQKVYPGGTERYVTDSIVPVGHDTEYLSRVIYGGTVDVVTGELVVDRAMVDLGTLNWTKSSSTSGGFYATNQIYYRFASDTSMVCSNYKFDGTRSSSPYFGVNGTLTANYGGVVIYEIYIRDESLADKTTSEFKTAMNGVQLCYEIATPQTYQLTPEEVKLLLGDNTIWSDGPVTLIYNADVTRWIEKKLS